MMSAWAITASCLLVISILLLILIVRIDGHHTGKLNREIESLRQSLRDEKIRKEGHIDQLTNQLSKKQTDYNNMVLKIRKKNVKIAELLVEIEEIKKTGKDRFKNIVDNKV